MREIKFRAWDKIEGKMWYPDAIMDGGRPMKCHMGVYISYPEQEPHDPVMQFTGLQDSKGVEIYEGDITRDGDIIEWTEDICGEYGCIGWNITTVGALYVSIVGNIYENPELLR
jgi:hypothetical protein